MSTSNEYADLFLRPSLSTPMFMWKLLRYGIKVTHIYVNMNHSYIYPFIFTIHLIPANHLRAFTRCTLTALVMLQLNVHLYANDSADTCWERRSREECINNNIYDSTNLLRRYCVWEPQQDIAVPMCQLSDPHITVNSSIYLAMIGCAWMAVLMTPLNFIFEYILFAYEVDKKERVCKVVPASDDVALVDRTLKKDIMIDVAASPSALLTPRGIPVGFEDSLFQSQKSADLMKGPTTVKIRKLARLNEYIREVNSTYDLIEIVREMSHLRLDLANQLRLMESDDSNHTQKRKRRLSLQWGFEVRQIATLLFFSIFTSIVGNDNPTIACP